MTVKKVQVKRSRRKTLAVEVTADSEVVVRAPYGVPLAEIQAFLDEKSDWIQSHLQYMKKRAARQAALPAISPAEILRLKEKARIYIPGRAAHYAARMGVRFGRITIRAQKTRWGSCTSSGNLNFNCLLMLTPPEVIAYVVVHELCHRLHMDHSPAFWQEVERWYPDYRPWKNWLREYGSQLIGRMTAGEK